MQELECQFSDKMILVPVHFILGCVGRGLSIPDEAGGLVQISLEAPDKMKKPV